jgi:hypothetical protein
MRINNIEGLTMKDLQDEVDRGGKFVIYQYCVSVLIMTFRQPTDVYFVRGHESAVGKGIQYSLISFVAGWWGIPWGPIYTIGSLINNFGGGKDVTTGVMQSLRQVAQQSEQAPQN